MTSSVIWLITLSLISAPWYNSCNCILISDNVGYQGIQNIYKNTIIPIKRTKNKKLTKQERKYNKIVSKIRIKVEHVFAWLKRFKILVNKCRKSKFRLMYLRFNLLCEIFNKIKPLK
ncbi:transposase family protein [Spiroplasma endosymbiont of Colias croceus]|uniref:transposase family protein n=1 Tax=Spiroplasma endosymbiont of Colias croceus TaxID=3066310 RepID=UPI0030D58FF6